MSDPTVHEINSRFRRGHGMAAIDGKDVLYLLNYAQRTCVWTQQVDADLMNMAPAKIAKLARQLIETGVDIEVATGKGSKLVNAKAVAANTG